MSRFKEGEGLIEIQPVQFDDVKLEEGKRYTVVLLADGDVFARGYATVGNGTIDEDFILVRSDTQAFLTLRIPLFSAHYYHNFDLMIRDDEETLYVFTNLRKPDGEGNGT
jgi:hypothetical protein